MDLDKLKISNFQRARVLYCPSGIELKIKSIENNFDCLFSFVQIENQLRETIEIVKSENRPVSLIIAYPKGTSKEYKAEVNRDSIVSLIKADGRFKAPKLVSLDENWSGFSFRFEPTQ